MRIERCSLPGTPRFTEDWRQIHEICCLTADSGAPIAQERWPFFGEVWTGPYRKLAPEWTWIARSPNRGVEGYLTGYPDSRSFEMRRLWGFEIPLVFQLLARRYPPSTDTQRFIRRALRLQRTPERTFPKEIREMLFSRYPAHLHINLRADSRGSGCGRLLVEAFFESLREKRIAGVHVFCGPKPKPFYERLGFTELAAIDFTPSARVFALTRML